MADRGFARREHALIRRLEIGLIDEGVRVVRAVPTDSPDEPTTGLAGSVVYDDRGLRVLAPSPVGSIRRAVDAIEELASAGAPPIDVVHAWGDACWSTAGRLAETIEAGLCVEVWSGASLKRCAAFERRFSGKPSDPLPGLWLAPDEAMLDALNTARLKWPCRLSKWGVHPADIERPPRSASRPVSFAVISSGVEPLSVLAVLDGLSRAARAANREILVFLDSAAAERHPGVWTRAKDLGLLDRLSVISDMESRRQLTLHSDVLVQPEARGEHRSILLEAMGSGMLVAAQADPQIEVLTHDRAMLVESPTVDAWASMFTAALSSSSTWERLIFRARTDIAQQRPAHLHVAATVSAYQTIVSGEPMPFSGAQASQPR